MARLNQTKLIEMKFQILLNLPKDAQLFVVRPEIRASHWFSDIKKAVTRDHDEVCVDARAVNRKYVLSVAMAFFRHHFVMGKYKTDAASKANRIVLVVKEREDLVEIKRRLKAQWFGNRLASEPANKLHPVRFCRVVQDYFAGAGAGAGGGVRIKVRVLDRAELKRQGFGLVLAVGDSSRAHPPHFLILEVGRGVGRGKRTICAVGKGVVFDSGGYDLKSSAGMLGMNGDKTGGGVAVALARYFGVEAPDRLPKDTRLVVLVPLVENMIGQHAQRVGDVHTAWNGKTVEVLNTDAEGRLILAAALADASRVYKPALLMDFATLTGWA
jgi:leucyl aminopeptidase